MEYTTDKNIDSNTRKVINFDLAVNLLKKYYPSKFYKNAWRDISNYLKENGFEHRQYSGYVSKETVTTGTVIYLAQDMSNKFDWLKYCVKQFDVTAVLDEYSLLDVIKNPHNIEFDSMNEHDEVSHTSLLDQINHADSIKDNMSTKHDLFKDRHDER